MAKGYWVVHVNVSDPSAYARYRAFVDPFLASRGGRFLVRGGTQHVTEGDAYPRTVIVEFPSYDAALSAYNSDEYSEGRRLRDGIAETDFAIVEGYEG
jgi:uncharacterized protein (DUF1330 family)